MGKALITGATGFIGGHLARALVERGEEVRCLVRGSSRVEPLKALGVQLVEGDVSVAESLGAATAEVDVVYHLAGLTKARGAAEFFRVNESGVTNVLAACRERATPPTVVMVSSLAAAGPALDGRPRTEEDPPRPVSNYGRSKRAGELAAVAFSGEIPITVVRPPIVLGEGDATGLTMFRMIHRMGWHLVPGRAPSRFSVVHVADLVQAIIGAAVRGTRLPPSNDHTAPSDNGKPCDPRGFYFIAGPETPTFGELGKLVGEALGRRRTLVTRFPAGIVWPAAAMTELSSRLRGRAPYVGIDKAREALAGDWTCSAARAAHDLGFAPAASLTDRLRQTAEWYRREGWL